MKYTIDITYFENPTTDYQKICNIFCDTYLENKTPRDELNEYLKKRDKSTFKLGYLDGMEYMSKEINKDFYLVDRKEI